MIEGTWTPMSEEEAELFEEIFVATREAHNDGVSKVRIAGMLSYLAAGAIDPQSLDAEQRQVEQEADTLAERMGGETEDEDALCPLCKQDGTYTEISDVRSQLGGQLFVEPCGHVVEFEDREMLGEWAEQFDPFDEEEEPI